MRWSVLPLPLGQLEAVDCRSHARTRCSAPKTELPTHHRVETTTERNPGVSTILAAVGILKTVLYVQQFPILVF